MGKNNSSITRVQPLGNAIVKNHDLLDTLLADITDNRITTFEEFSDGHVFFSGHGGEKSLPPTPKHLLAIIDKMASDKSVREHMKKHDTSSASNKMQREKLFCLDPGMLAKSREEFKTWNTFEGDSFPDLFIENENNILIIEGKRTESNITTSTTYLKRRCQMIRHIENALYYCQEKKRVIAFYILEKNCGYENHCTKSYFEKSFDEETIRKDGELKETICNSFYGYTTWQNIGKLLNIEFPL